MKNVLKPLTECTLIQLRLTPAASATDTTIQNVSGTTLMISNNEMVNIMKIVESFEESDLLVKGVSKAIKNEPKEQKSGFLYMLLGT